FGASLVLLVVMMGIYRVQPTVELLWLPVALLVTLIFSVGCAYVAALIGVWISDFRPFAISIMRAMFFLAPGLVSIRDIGGRAEALVKLNPLTGLFESYRSIALRGEAPRAWQLAFPLAWSAVLLLVALPLYVLERRGRVAALLSVDAGLMPTLTGRENCVLLGVLAGLSRRQARRSLAEIQERTALGDEFDNPVSSYSQGMRARLGFAVADQVSP